MFSPSLLPAAFLLVCFATRLDGDQETAHAADAPAPSRSAESQPRRHPQLPKTTYIYRTVEQCELRADVYRPDSARGRVPVVVWIHGGALILGSRSDINRLQAAEYLRAGYAVVAVDYRLAPETKLPEIIDDLRSAFQWVREQGPHLFNADPQRVAAIGHSAGGYLTLMSGFCVSPRPQVLVSFYGYGDITGQWLLQPDPFYRKLPLVTRERAYSKVGNSPVADPQGNRRPFYLYARQQGLWSHLVSGRDPQGDRDWFMPFCPIRNVGTEYPPTLLLHGDHDTDVPYQQSVDMANRLSHAHVVHELITIPEGGHGFDADMEKPATNDAFKKVLRFLREHLRS